MELDAAALDALRLEGDPLADAVIAEVYTGGQAAAVNGVLRHLFDNDQAIPADLPPSVQAYLRATDTPPAWVDPLRVQGAGRFFASHGLHISLVLSTAGLIECYAAQRAVKVLDATHQMDHPQRRVAESAQFCLHLMDPRAFSHGGKLIPTVQKVRLMHAAVRWLLLHNPHKAWPVAELGVPICQEDLFGAFLLFSLEVIYGLKRLGIPVTDEEAADYYYVWRVVGVMLGIRPDILPLDVADADALYARFRNRHLGPSPEGIRLTHQLIGLYDDLIPGECLDGVMATLIRIMVGEELADWMQVPRSRWAWAAHGLIHLNQLLDRADDHRPLVGIALDKIEWAFLQGQFHILNGGRRITYEIPTDLRAAWGLAPIPDPAVAED
ncbi:MAG: DUF2236 domain-containing protein [Chloroflexota bacterium]|nr:DUF2236 domain-containing protein [Chloroflexota bacterium]